MAIQFGFVAALLLYFVAFLTLVFSVFELAGWTFFLNALFLFGMMLLASVAMGGVADGRRSGWITAMLSSLLFIIYGYSTYLFGISGEYTSIMIASSIILFVITIINISLAPRRRRRPMKTQKERMQPVQTYYAEENQPAPKAVVKKSFKPGKFVASRFASTYHAPKCEWANNISRINRVWFRSHADARKAKMKPHSCIA